MVWYCEDCEREVNVIADMGNREFGKNMDKSEILSSIGDDPTEMLVRCVECDGTRMVWK
jgi:hypothetical protein